MDIYVTLGLITVGVLIYMGKDDKELDSPTLFLRSCVGGILFPFVWSGLFLFGLSIVAGFIIDRAIKKRYK